MGGWWYIDVEAAEGSIMNGGRDALVFNGCVVIEQMIIVVKGMKRCSQTFIFVHSLCRVPAILMTWSKLSEEVVINLILCLRRHICSRMQSEVLVRLLLTLITAL